MDVFIGNLPGSATLLDLTAFLDGIDLRTDFQCEAGRDQYDRNYHFFVARMASREAGLELITRLNGRVFEGRAVEAREYRRRAPCREWRGMERRVNPW